MLCAPHAGAQLSLFEDEEAREQLASMEERLERMQANLRTLANEVASLNSQKQELLRLVRELSGLVEEANLVANRHDSRIDEIQDQVSARGDQLERDIERGFDRVAALIVSDDAQLYDGGMLAYQGGDVTVAEDKLRELLLRFPGSSYAHAATYWLGRILLDRGLADEARDTLTGLLLRHPDSPRVPDALLLLSGIAEEGGDADAAKSLLQRLLDNHPTSHAADRARLAGAGS